MPALQKSRNIVLSTYANLDDVSTILASKPQINHYAYIVHDKDIKADGNLVTPHTHIVLELQNPVAPSTVVSWFNGCIDDKQEKANTFAEIARDKTAMYRYLIHLDNPEKYQYSVDNVFCDSINYYKSVIDGNDANTAVQIIDDILNGESFYVLAKKYGRDFVIHHAYYINFANLVRGEFDPAKKLRGIKENE